jgi:hypothetical protein
MKLTQEQALDLANGETVELDNGMSLRFRMEPDDITINDFDCYGKVSHIGRGNGDRPAGFDGMAEKLWGYNEQYWWQPPDDLRPNWHNYEHKNHLREVVRNILSFGFDIYILELCNGTNAYGEPIVVDYTACGGHEPLQKDTDMAETLIDLAHDLDVSLVK